MNTKSVSPIFEVSNLQTAVNFYTSQLGFKEEFRFGSYAGVSLGNAEIHLSFNEDRNELAGQGNAYIFCDQVDEYYGEIQNRGVTITSAIANHSYGMRDFQISDMDGNLIGFGCHHQS